jgi:tetratricopeptide (TPR) repeat protein
MRHLALFFIASLALTAPVMADFAEDMKLCSRSSNLDERVAACTRQISSGRWQGRNLADTYANRGNGYYLKREYDRAIADLTEAIRLDPAYAAAYNERGLAYSGKGDYDRAIADYSEGMRIDPNAATLYSNRGSPTPARANSIVRSPTSMIDSARSKICHRLWSSRFRARPERRL